MSKKIAKKKVSKKVTKKVSLQVKGPVSFEPFKFSGTVTAGHPELTTKLVKIEKSKNINHLFERSESLSQDLYKISEVGQEVLILETEIEFIHKAFEDFQKAQAILKAIAR